MLHCSLPDKSRGEASKTTVQEAGNEALAVCESPEDKTLLG